MSIVKIPDAGGDTMTLLELAGRRYPPFPEDHVRAMSTVKLRPDDIILCSYQKSGMHWVSEILHMMCTGTLDLSAVHRKSGLLEKLSPGTADSYPSPRILGTHVLFTQMPPDLLKNKTKIVFLYRNPKDIIASLYYHYRNIDIYEYSGTWTNFVEMAMQGKFDYGSWSEYMLNWETGLKDNPQLQSCVITFEDMKHHPSRELRRLATFLGKDYEEDFLQQIQDKCSFSSMKTANGPERTSYRNGKPVFYRKGEVGDWKNWFTVSQSEAYDKMLQEEMKDSQFKWKEYL